MAVVIFSDIDSATNALKKLPFDELLGDLN